MAKGFLDEPAKEADMVIEDIGKDKYDNIISCKIHDLVHVSLSISKSETLILKSDSMDSISNVQNLLLR